MVAALNHPEIVAIYDVGETYPVAEFHGLKPAPPLCREPDYAGSGNCVDELRPAAQQIVPVQLPLF